jgi:hypothetical protein
MKDMDMATLAGAIMPEAGMRVATAS